ncbi:hypothetical protein ACWC4A_52735 [Streptomyces mirabilis]
MGRDRVPRLQLVVFMEDDTGPRLCRGCGGPLTPSAKATAAFCSSACRSRHWRRLRLRVVSVPGSQARDGHQAGSEASRARRVRR